MELELERKKLVPRERIWSEERKNRGGRTR